jgi:hypothetical protein
MFNPNFGSTPSQITSQTASGSCDANLVSTSSTNVWDIGVRGDMQPGGTHPAGGALQPLFSLLTNSGTFAEGNTSATMNTHGESNVLAPAQAVNSTYCNGSRVPVEALADNAFAIWGVPPGTNESNALPTPVFSLTAGAVVDEGNNWINLRWGPLSLNVPNAKANGNAFNFDPKVSSGSGALDKIGSSAPTYGDAPSIDFYGNPRKTGNDPVDIGAVEYQKVPSAALTVTPASQSFGFHGINTTTVQNLTLTNSGNAAATNIAVAFTGPFTRSTTNPGTCGTTLAFGTTGNTCTIGVAFAPTAVGPVNGTATITANVTVTNSPVALSGVGTQTGRFATVTPNSLAFGNQGTNVRSAAQTLTVFNTGSVALSGQTLTFNNSVFARQSALQGGAGSCTGTLNVGASCTINVVFTPTAANNYNATLTIAYPTTAGGAPTITGSPVGLSGTGTAPGVLSFTAATNGSLSTIFGVRTLTFTIPNPRAPVTSQVTIQNTGSGPLSITAESITGNAGLFSITGTTCSFTTPLAPAATCTVSIQYATPATRPGFPNIGSAAVANNGANGGSTTLGLSAQ